MYLDIQHNRCRSGSVFIEAAIVIPVFLFVASFAFDVASWLYNRNRLMDASAVAARQAATVIAEYLTVTDLAGTGSSSVMWEECSWSSATNQYCNTCSTAARWGQAVVREIIDARVPDTEGVKTGVYFGPDANGVQMAQPVVSVEIRRPYPCLWCMSWITGELVSRAEYLIEDRALTACSAVKWSADNDSDNPPCHPREQQCR